MSQDAALDSWIWTLGSSVTPEQIVGGVAADDRVAADAPVVGQPDLVHGVAANGQGRHPLGDEHLGLDGARGAK